MVWTCLAECFAKVFETSLEDLFDLLGHDGSEVIWPQYEDPMCRRGFHIQEMVCVGLRLGFAIVQIESQPSMYPDPAAEPFSLPEVQLHRFFNLAPGVVTGYDRMRGCRHALAIVEGRVFDPAGVISRYGDFDAENLFLVFKTMLASSKDV